MVALIPLTALAPSDDRDVIQAALLSLFEKDAPSLTKGELKQVCLEPQCMSSKRSDFEAKRHKTLAEVESSIQHAEGRMTDRATSDEELPILAQRLEHDRRYRSTLLHVRPGARTFAAAAVSPLKQNEWHPRIIVGQRAQGADDLLFSVSPPTYSPDGEHAFLDLHSKQKGWDLKMTTLLHRTPNGWRTV